MKTNVTFRDRVIEFWNWFPTVAGPISESVLGGSPDVSAFAEQVREHVGGLAWAFGPGTSEGRLSLTVTGEGQVARQLLSHFWISRAVEVPNWDFYSARQPAPADKLAELCVEVAGAKIDAQSLMVATDVDEENEVVNVLIWHDQFDEMSPDARLQITFLLLDEALGEFGTQTQLGSIEFKPDSTARSLNELPEFLDQLWLANQWERRSPLETYSGYRSEPSEGFARSDTIAGYTCVPQVVLGYLNNQGVLEDDPVAATGAQYMYVTLEQCGVEHHADPLSLRTEVEEQISSRLTGGGYVLGGASGVDNSYVDVVVFDGQRSLAAIEEALELAALPCGFTINPFAHVT